ncbi:uncharacterized protein MELLADRAFT_63554 [Melampsora larici-populina 98AG31]|uniref:Uncharacterized protein n=1 Tax=Melampsora larici-populina (strain 98AG31 / pathotype 3-4-7) TaxID=747676 RepID=F4RN25_MELLP|nr:uncharacterized protein MELLADRAFT_63554 [Melampsora larici-populina 98AG31]EGG06223.1 hypothetical protein MELLADRAFT_63554 [Melampsora larici-populina 98AG31]
MLERVIGRLTGALRETKSYQISKGSNQPRLIVSFLQKPKIEVYSTISSSRLNWKQKMKTNSSSISLISFLISILVSSLLSLHCENDLHLLADMVYSELPKGPEHLHTGEGSGMSAVATQTSILQKGLHTTKVLGLERLREMANFTPEHISLVPTPTLQKGLHPTKVLGLERLRELKNLTPESVGARSWKVYYRVAPRASSAPGQIPEIKNLAQAVMELGKDFTSTIYTDDGIAEYIVPYMTLAYNTLQLDSLGMRERIWAVGVLACLKWSIPAQQSIMKSEVFKRTFPPFGFRGNLEVFLLKDQPLRKIVKQMWEGIEENPSDHAVIKEALQRSSLADSLMTQLPKNLELFKEFRWILKFFLNLKNPIEFRNADYFIEDIERRLGDFDFIDPWKKVAGFDEAKALIQLLLYMHERYIRSRETFLRLTKACNLGKSVLDFHIQVYFGYYPQRYSTRKIYKFMMAERGSNFEDLMPLLKVLAQEGLLIPMLSEMSLLP